MPSRSRNNGASAGIASDKRGALLDYAVSHSPAIFYVAEYRDDRWVTFFISPNVETITGHKPAVFTRETGFGLTLVHPDDLDSYLAVIESLSSVGACVHEYRYQASDGRYRWFRDDLRLTAADGPGPEQIVGCMIDITERKEAERARQKAVELLDGALERIPHGFALYDGADRLVRCNSAYAALYRAPIAALVGLTGAEMSQRAEAFCATIVDGEGNERSPAWMGALDPDCGGGHSDIYEMQVKDGRWFLVTVQLTEEGGTAILRTDITDQKRIEASLRDAEAFKTGIIDSALDCIVAMDAEGRIIEFNPAAERTFGHRREDALGRTVGELIVPEELRERHEAGLKRYLESGRSEMLDRRVEMKAQRADGDRFPVELSISEVTASGRRVFTASLRDITEQKRSRKERKRLLQILNDAIESIPNGFAIYDAEERLTLCNTAYAAMYGKAPADLIGEGSVELLRAAMPKIKSLDGRAVAESDRSAEGLNQRIREATLRPLEAELTNGRWIMVTGHPTADGGTVFIRTDITRAKQTEAAAREREQHYRRIVEAQPLPVWMADLDSGTILYESAAAARLFGHGSPVAAGRNVRDHYANLQDREDIARQLRETGALDNDEVQLKKEDGEVFWVSATSRLLVIDRRAVVITSMIDLTERKQREAELRQARETLEDAIESLSEGFALYDADDRLVMCNQRYRDYNRESADLLVPGMKWQDFIRAGAERGQYLDALGRTQEWLDERTKLRGKWSGRLEIEQADGRVFEVSNQRTRNGGIVVTRTDISHRKAIERVLRESENLIRHVLEAAPMPVAMSRAKDGEIIYESPASAALFYRGPKPVGPNRTLTRYVDVEDRDRYLALLHEQGFVQDFELQLKGGDGKAFWATMSGRLIDYKGEQVIVSSHLDLTERRAVEAEMARQREALHQSEKLTALGSLLAGVAHELNNPLSVVVGQALLLQETVSDPKIVKRATKIGAAADRCARIVRAFLAMARKRPPERAEVDLNDLLTSIVEMLAYSLRTESIELMVDLAAGLPSVWGDADQLNQVFVNLLVNARQALADSEGTRMIAVSSEYDAARERICVRVADSGPGIADDIRSRIFDPFFTTKEVGVGTGIGLSVSYGIVESHQGTILVQSEPGQGATFVVELPAAKAEQIAEAGRQHGGAPVANRSILVIDDEPEIAQTMSDILGADGHRIEVTDSGAAALRLLAERDFDVILCDLRMPGLDGQGLYEALKERRPQILDRIAFVTGDTFGRKAAEFLAETGLPHLEKPFTPDEVRRIVERIAGSAAPAD